MNLSPSNEIMLNSGSKGSYLLLLLLVVFQMPLANVPSPIRWERVPEGYGVPALAGHA
jgi:hypothetical protein